MRLGAAQRQSGVWWGRALGLVAECLDSRDAARECTVHECNVKRPPNRPVAHVCVRACVRACMRAFVCGMMRACVCACMSPPAECSACLTRLIIIELACVCACVRTSACACACVRVRVHACNSCMRACLHVVCRCTCADQTNGWMDECRMAGWVGGWVMDGWADG